MALTEEQKYEIQSYFEVTYHLYFGVPGEREQEELTPNEHVMILQYFYLHLLNQEQEPLETALLEKQVRGEPVQELLHGFVNERTSPFNPSMFFDSDRFLRLGNEDEPATTKDIQDHCKNVVAIMARKTNQPYLAADDYDMDYVGSAAEGESSSFSSRRVLGLIQFGLFAGTAAASVMTIISRLRGPGQ